MFQFHLSRGLWQRRRPIRPGYGDRLCKDQQVPQCGQGSKTRNREKFTLPSQRTSRNVANIRYARSTVANHRIHTDYGPLATRYYIIVLIDKYSGYPEAEVMNSTSAKTIPMSAKHSFAKTPRLLIEKFTKFTLRNCSLSSRINCAYLAFLRPYSFEDFGQTRLY